MKTFIILKGIAKTEKIRWVQNEGLNDFFLDINAIRKLYSNPELFYPGKGKLNKSQGDSVYYMFMKILISRLSKGCLVIIDPESESLNPFEKLAEIFGYTVFYVIQDLPQDYLKKPGKYNLSYYPPKRKEAIEKEVSIFLEQSYSDKLKISHFSDIEKYWETKCKRENYFKVSGPVLHISDIHSNYDLYKKLPSWKNYDIQIFHGDYIDGPEEGGSRKMIDEILWTSWKKSRVIWLEGNHELRLRKHLGIIMLSNNKGTEIRDLLRESLQEDYLRSTYKEFSGITPEEAKKYLEKMNSILKIFCILCSSQGKYICTHSGLRFPEQICPKYIGNIIYGGRDMIRYDKDFSNYTNGTSLYSIHAHCKYNPWQVYKFPRVINLDPPSNEKIIFARQYNNKWKICQLEK